MCKQGQREEKEAKLLFFYLIKINKIILLNSI